MNKFILNTMNRKNLTKEQLDDNTATADADADDAYAAAYAADAADADAADAAALAVAAATAAAAAKYWLEEYFKESSENRADYEAELKRDNSFREVK